MVEMVCENGVWETLHELFECSRDIMDIVVLLVYHHPIGICQQREREREGGRERETHTHTIIYWLAYYYDEYTYTVSVMGKTTYIQSVYT